MNVTIKFSQKRRSRPARRAETLRWAQSCLVLLAGGVTCVKSLSAAEPAASNGTPVFEVISYRIEYSTALFTNAPAPELSAYKGTNVSLNQIVQAASEVLTEFQKRGYTNANISIARQMITNGVVSMNIYEGVFPQVLISGKSFRPGEPGFPSIAEAGTGATNVAPEVKTNAPPRGFPVRAYEITGDTLLTTNTLNTIVAKGVGTNVTISDIIQVASDLKQEYRNRGYPTVDVTIPKQQIANETVKLQVFEGRLSEILVTQNHYFSSNNVMRALPSLHTNMLLVGPVFSAELNRANANQDRQISGKLLPGPDPDTTTLDLQVDDRLPLHGKVELNNQNSPGTPELRVNSSAVYNNLWQENHQLGVQYSFSPEEFKQGPEWNFYDLPLVANYSGFYRMPLGNPGPISEQVAAQPGGFGYSEATKKFNLPPPSGTAELNVYASRSTIDTGVQTLGIEDLYDVPGVRTVTRQDSQEDFTINNALGFRLSAPLPQMEEITSTVSGGFDYKTYDANSFKTNNFKFVEITLDAQGFPNPPVVSQVSSPVPATYVPVRYLPMTVRWDGSRKDTNGVWVAGFGYSVNFFGGLFSNSSHNFRTATGSAYGDGFYHVLTGSLSREQVIFRDWRLTLRADGQWANEPLITNEEFSTGGVSSVRGYHEGEIFGDRGWHISLEQKSPGLLVGTVGRNAPLIFRGSIFMDYAESYLLDPQSRNGHTTLWGTGLGFVASIGSAWDARFLFGVPLLSAGTIEAYQPYFNFSLTAQF